MEKIQLKAAKRKITGRKVKTLRREGIIPANIYGKKIKSLAVQVNNREFAAVFAKAGETGLIELEVDGEKKPVLIHNVSYHPVTGIPYHIDFFQVDLKEKVTAKVPVAVIGVSPAVRDKIGVLLHIISEVEVEALPADLPDKIEVDIGKLSVVDDGIKVNQLIISDKVKLLTDTNLEVIKIAPLVSKEAEKMAAEEAAAKAAAAETAAAETTPSQAPSASTEAATSKESSSGGKQE